MRRLRYQPVIDAAIVFDANGDVTGLVSEPLTPTIQLTVLPNTQTPREGGHDWAPDGTKIVYVDLVTNSDQQIRVADLIAGESTLLVTGGTQVAWSPDGAKIAYQAFQDIYTISPGGTGAKRIAKHTGNGPNRTFVGVPH